MSHELRYNCFIAAREFVKEPSDVNAVIEVARQIAAFVFDTMDVPVVVTTTLVLPEQPAEPTVIEDRPGRKAVEMVMKNEKKKAPAVEPEAAPKAPEPQDEDDGEKLYPPADPEREKKITDLVSELKPNDRVVMRKLLEKVETKHLQAAFNHYLSKVLHTK